MLAGYSLKTLRDIESIRLKRDKKDLSHYLHCWFWASIAPLSINFQLAKTWKTMLWFAKADQEILVSKIPMDKYLIKVINKDNRTNYIGVALLFLLLDWNYYLTIEFFEYIFSSWIKFSSTPVFSSTRSSSKWCNWHFLHHKRMSLSRTTSSLHSPWPSFFKNQLNPIGNCINHSLRLD